MIYSLLSGAAPAVHDMAPLRHLMACSFLHGLTAGVQATAGGTAGAPDPCGDHNEAATVQRPIQTQGLLIASPSAGATLEADDREALAAFGRLAPSPEGTQMIRDQADGLRSPAPRAAAPEPAAAVAPTQIGGSSAADAVLAGSQGAGADAAWQPPLPLPSRSPTGVRSQDNEADDFDGSLEPGSSGGTVQRPRSAPAGAAAAAEQPAQTEKRSAHASGSRSVALQRLKNRASQRQAAALSSSAELARPSAEVQRAEAGSEGRSLATLVAAAARTRLTVWLHVSGSPLPLRVS